MVQPSGTADDPPVAVHEGLIPTRFPTRYADDLAAGLSARSANRTVTGRHVRALRLAMREVVVVEVAGRLGDVVEQLDGAIQQTLADGPRGVVCDLSTVVHGAEPAAVETLATAGRHVRAWPGVPVALTCLDSRVRETLATHPVGSHLIVETTVHSAVSAVLATPCLAVEWLRLAAHPTAPRAAREFVTRTLLDWRLGRAIPFAILVVSELVASSSVNAGTDMDVSIAWSRGALRLTVRDHGPGLPSQRNCDLDLHGRGLTVVAGLSREFGVMPAADGGKVVWAVIDAPRPGPVNQRLRSGKGAKAHETPEFTDGLGRAELPFCAGSGTLMDEG